MLAPRRIASAFTSGPIRVILNVRPGAPDLVTRAGSMPLRVLEADTCPSGRRSAANFPVMEKMRSPEETRMRQRALLLRGESRSRIAPGACARRPAARRTARPSARTRLDLTPNGAPKTCILVSR